MEALDRCKRMHEELKDLIGTWVDRGDSTLPEVIGVLSLTTHEYMYLANVRHYDGVGGQSCPN